MALERLVELEYAWQELATLRETINILQQLRTEEARIGGLSVGLEQQRTAIATDRAKLLEEQRDFYRTLYESSRPGRGLGCRLKKIFTLGLARCR